MFLKLKSGLYLNPRAIVEARIEEKRNGPEIVLETLKSKYSIAITPDLRVQEAIAQGIPIDPRGLAERILMLILPDIGGIPQEPEIFVEMAIHDLKVEQEIAEFERVEAAKEPGAIATGTVEVVHRDGTADVRLDTGGKVVAKILEEATPKKKKREKKPRERKEEAPG